MKIVRFLDPRGDIRCGIVSGDDIREAEGDIFGRFSITSRTHSIGSVRILPPCEPTKIVAVGLNYRDHAEEMKRDIPEEPMLFMKPSTSVISHDEEIRYPSHMSERVDYEGELAVVISKTATMVPEEKAGEYILGYTCINDVTARDLQSRDIQFTRAKGFDTFAPIGPFIETDIDPSDLAVRTYLNGEVRQDSTTANMIFSVNRLVSFISSVMTLLPGDVIATGTPSGIGPMKPGDVVEVEVEGVGRLRNHVV